MIKVKLLPIGSDEHHAAARDYIHCDRPSSSLDVVRGVLQWLERWTITSASRSERPGTVGQVAVTSHSLRTQLMTTLHERWVETPGCASRPTTNVPRPSHRAIIPPNCCTSTRCIKINGANVMDFAVCNKIQPF